MKNKKGFIQIPLLIAIIAGVLVLGGAGYFGVKQYQDYRGKNIKNENTQATSTSELSEVEKLRQEVEALKKQQTPSPKQQIISATPAKRVVLSNSKIIELVKPATVYIETTQGTGSGMIIDTDGYILTNAHVVSGATIASVKLLDGRALSALVTGRDEIIDLAILKVSGSNFTKVVLGNSDTVAQGDEVFTLGYPFGLEGDVSFKEGTISRKLSDNGSTYLETSAEIHPGNSGGPLVNVYGEVIGINTATFGKSISGVSLGETIKLAIPINIAKNLISDLKNGRNVVVPKKPEVSQYSPPADDYISPIIKSITIERPAGNQDIIAITISTDEPSFISVNCTFEFSPQDNNKLWKNNTDKTKETTIIYIPSPSYNENTKMYFSIRATDAYGNVGKVEYYSIRVAEIPGIGGLTYYNPKAIK